MTLSARQRWDTYADFPMVGLHTSVDVASAVRALERFERINHALAARKAGAADVGTKFTLPRKRHQDQAREDTKYDFARSAGSERFSNMQMILGVGQIRRKQIME
jgi:hypothetical protein